MLLLSLSLALSKTASTSIGGLRPSVLALLQRLTLAMPMQGYSIISEMSAHEINHVWDLRRTVRSCQTLSEPFPKHRVLADEHEVIFFRLLFAASTF